MKAETLNQASDLLHQLLRVAENRHEAYAATEPYALTYFIRPEQDDLRARVLSAMKAMIFGHLTEEIERLKAELSKLDVVVTDDDISTHLAKGDARRKEWEEAKAAKTDTELRPGSAIGRAH